MAAVGWARGLRLKHLVYLLLVFSTLLSAQEQKLGPAYMFRQNNDVVYFWPKDKCLVDSILLKIPNSRAAEITMEGKQTIKACFIVSDGKVMMLDEEGDYSIISLKYIVPVSFI